MKALFATLLLTTSAFAWPSCSGHWVSVPKGTTGGTLYNTGDLLFQCQSTPPTSSLPPVSSASSSNSSATASASTNSNQNQKQTQSQIANGGTASNGPQSNVQETVNNQIRQAPMAYAPESIPTAPCRVAGSAGVSAPVGGISLGGSKADKECELRATAAMFAALHQPKAALEVACQSKYAKAVKNCTSLLVEAEPSTPVVVPAPAPVVVPITVAPAPVEVLQPVVVTEKPQVITVTPRKKKAAKPCISHNTPSVVEK